MRAGVENWQSRQESRVKIPIQVEPAPPGGVTPSVEYRWDPDTEILSAQLSPRTTGKGMSGSVELEGSDGSWLILDVSAGHINGVEVAVWPDVQMRSTLKPPDSVQDVHVIVSGKKAKAETASLEVETAMLAEADTDEKVFHFVIGKRRQTRTVRFARDLLVDLDESSNLAGLWLLNVPPFRAHV